MKKYNILVKLFTLLVKTFKTPRNIKPTATEHNILHFVTISPDLLSK